MTFQRPLEEASVVWGVQSPRILRNLFFHAADGRSCELQWQQLEVSSSGFHEGDYLSSELEVAVFDLLFAQSFKFDANESNSPFREELDFAVEGCGFHDLPELSRQIKGI